MGLILPQKVIVKWNNMNMQRFIDKGYTYTGYQTEASINVCDLADKSNIKVKVICDYCGKQFKKEWCRVKFSLDKNRKISCSECGIRDNSDRRLSHNDYYNKVKGNYSVIPIEKYIKSDIEIKHECLSCGNQFLIKPNRVLDGLKNNINCCNKCNNFSLTVGVNDLWTTHPQVASLLNNSEDGYKYKHGSDKKLNWRCGECGSLVKEKSVYNTVNNGLSCPVCNDGFSIGFKYVCTILNEFRVSYITEKSFNWLKNRYYDIFIPSHNIICEIHGAQHYLPNGFTDLGGRTLDEEMENDKLKFDSAVSNGIASYIVIDSREPSFEFISNSIINSELATLFDLSKIDLKSVFAKSLSSYITKACDLWNNGMSVPNIAKSLKIATQTVSRYLHTCTDAGLCEYKGFEERFKSVVCLNTGEIFINIDEAAKKYSINSNNISHVCQGVRGRHYAGKDINGVKLQWMFADEYSTKSQDEINAILNTKYKKPTVFNHKVICLDTLEIFDSLKEAKLKYNAPSISDCCRGFCNHTGYHPELKIKLSWKYYDDYLSMIGGEVYAS